MSTLPEAGAGSDSDTDLVNCLVILASTANTEITEAFMSTQDDTLKEMNLELDMEVMVRQMQNQLEWQSSLMLPISDLDWSPKLKTNMAEALDWDWDSDWNLDLDWESESLKL
jgi:hypothetical protein